MSEARDSVCEQVRAACAWVAGRARSVHIDERRLGALAAGLTGEPKQPAPPDPATDLLEAGSEARAAFLICLDAINFGSGWWPTSPRRCAMSASTSKASSMSLPRPRSRNTAY